MAVETTNALGQRLLDRFAAGDATADQLTEANTKGWISDADLAAATAA